MIYPFLPTIARGLGVEPSAIQLAITARSSLGLLSPVLGSLSDQWGRKRAMLFGGGLFALAMLLVVLSPTYPALFAVLLLAAASKVIFDPAMQAYLGDRVQYSQRGLVIALTEFGWSGAYLVGMPFVGWLIARSGWNAPFGVLGMLAVVTLIWLWRVLPNDTLYKAARPTFRQGVRLVMAHPAARAALIFGLLISASSEMIGIVYGEWMEKTFRLSVIELGNVTAVIGIAELVSHILVAVLVDRLGKRRSVMMSLGLYALTCLLLPIIAVNLNSALAILFGFYLFFEFAVVSAISLWSELVPEARATLLGLVVTAFYLGRMFGSLVGPVLFKSFGLIANGAVGAGLNLVALVLVIWLVHENAAAPAPSQQPGA
jgi:predicted MFS family arabinose efflux permease